jgi:hypothetical protein
MLDDLNGPEVPSGGGGFDQGFGQAGLGGLAVGKVLAQVDAKATELVDAGDDSLLFVKWRQAN